MTKRRTFRQDEVEELAPLIDRLLGCLETPWVDGWPLQPGLSNVVTFAQAFNATMQIRVTLAVTDDGRAIRWVVSDSCGMTLKQGVWALSTRSFSDLLAELEEQARGRASDGR